MIKHNWKWVVLLFIILILISPNLNAGFLGIKANTEKIIMPVSVPFTGDGIGGLPDSMAIVTYGDGSSAADYTASYTTYPFTGSGLDTTKYGDTLYWYVPTISDIDGAGGQGTLGIQVSMYYKDTSTVSFGVVQIISATLSSYLSYLDASIAAVPTVGEIYAEFISGSNEDIFKSDSTYINTAIDAISAKLDSTMWAAGNRSDTWSVTVFGTDTIGVTNITVDTLTFGIGAKADSTTGAKYRKIYYRVFTSSRIDSAFTIDFIAQP